MAKNTSSDGTRKRAAKPSAAPGPKPANDRPKVIILFSDGTGNSSAKLHKTNVWRMYEALDLGPPANPNDELQVAYYDNGVGTSNFRPLAALGGIFGFGLKRNIFRLYAFLCRNYRPGDRIYAFGFSRGAFTIRLLVGLIADQGVLKYEDEGALAYQMRDAYRAFCKHAWPNRWPARKIAGVTRRIRAGMLYAKRRILRQKLYSQTTRYHPDIDFVGVWDTVAAYGGPIAEITRGIDDWIWPLTMPHYGLPTKVLNARHALALDDERDAFQPLLWDEVRELNMVADGLVKPGRLRQVWFTGMHSDVGGGYPDESLSYISLLWMMDEIVPALRLLPEFTGRVAALANIFGPLHNSREGVGAYYRYQPRKIRALLNPIDHRTLILRDPEVSRGIGPHGLLTKVRIHESVIARITAGTDRYAPIALPADFEIIRVKGPLSRPMLPREDLDRYDEIPAERRRERFDLQENAWNLIWWRRLTYFVTVLASLALVAIPIYPTLFEGIEKICSDARCFASTPIGWLGYVLPDIAKLWLGSFVDKPVATLLLIALIFALLAFGRSLEAKLRDRVRGLWDAYFEEKPWPRQPRGKRLRAFRESSFYQYLLFSLKWRVMPTIAGGLILLSLALVGLATATQTYLAFAEPREIFCTSPGPVRPGATIQMLTRSTCTDLAAEVKRNRKYRLSLRVTHGWADAQYDATPEHGVTEAMPWYMTRIAPAFQRVVKANWLKPLIEIRSLDGSPARRLILGPPVYVDLAHFKSVPGKPGLYRADFTAKRDGHLYMFVNDAALPLWPGAFYGNNQGSALVKVTPLD